MSAICHDQRRPSPIREPHGPWWLTVWLPLGHRRALYLAASTGPRFTPHLGRRGIATKRLCVSLPPFHEPRPRVVLHRWCAHIDVRYTACDEGQR